MFYPSIPAGPAPSQHWDYLIVTAANERQAAAYESQMRMRQVPGVTRMLVVPDAGGRRIGSGGSTVQCLLEVLRREAAPPEAAAEVLRRLRILIVHAGGDSRRLPAYSPCGKIFVPLPGESSIFERLVPTFLALPEGRSGAGQVVVAAGDALILFAPGAADFSRPGINVLAAKAAPEEAARHGVICPSPDGSVLRFLQKPGVGEQANAGAIAADGRTLLDVGVMSMDAGSAARLVHACAGRLSFRLDLYREICCALGSQATLAGYLAATRQSGSQVPEPVLAELFEQLRSLPLHVSALQRCDFLHFGSTSQLISSGIQLAGPPDGILRIASIVEPPGRVDARESWIEGCRIRAPLTLRGRNVLVGADVDEPFELPPSGCLDIAPGPNQYFIRYYGVDDSFKDANFCGRPLPDWLEAESRQPLWNARIFPAEQDPQAYVRWRWMLDIARATSEQKSMLLAANRYSSAEIALRIDHAAFYARRTAILCSPRS
ncbi:MAG TPA: L-fucokinase [Bryobacteraceae bacterium]|nr:L-fucokinase [Bryobacteraceae bacterium]